MYRIKFWMPVEASEEDEWYETRKAAEWDKAQMEEAQPENIYQVVESEEEERDFIHADTWRQLNANDIISSIDIGLSVLKEKEGYNKERHRRVQQGTSWTVVNIDRGDNEDDVTGCSAERREKGEVKCSE